MAKINIKTKPQKPERAMKSMTIADVRVIELMDYALKNDLVTSQGEFWERIGYCRTGISAVRRGVQHFRVDHITKACALTGASADWVLGIETGMFRPAYRSTIDTLKTVVAEMKGRRMATRSWQDSIIAKNNMHA